MNMNLGSESEFQEFKLSMSQADKGIRSLAAMLNRHNFGTVYFGVDDNGDVVGLDVGKDTLMDLRNRIRNLIEPAVLCDIEECMEETGKIYVKVSARGSDVPYSFDGRFYVRNVSADECVPVQLLRKMFANSNADVIAHARSVRQDLSFTGLRTLLLSRNLHVGNDPSFFRNFNLQTESGEFNVMAELLSDQNPHSLKVVCFAGKDKTRMVQRREYSGKSLLICMSEVLDFMDSLNQMKVDLSGSVRKETPLFSFASFREAWVNACLHNSWKDGVPPSVFIFDDRMEIMSYGGIPYVLPESEFYCGRSIPVNKGLLTVFFASGFAEQTGHGVPTIVNDYGKEAFSISPNFVNVTLPFSFEPAFVQARKAQDVSSMRLTQNQRNVADHLRDNPESTLQDAADGCSLSLICVKKIVSALKEMGLVSRTGSRKKGRWVVSEYYG